MTLRLTHLLVLCTLIFSLVGIQSVSAASVGKTLSGNSRVHCPEFELVDLGPYLPEGRAEVTSGVSGQSRKYTMLDDDPIHVWNITYTLAPSISSPAYEEKELQYKKGQGIQTFDCGDDVEEDDRELNQYYIDFEAWIQAKGRIWGLTYGSNAESTVLVRNKARKDGSNRVSGMDDFHGIRLAQAVTGSPTVSVAATGNTTGSSNDSNDNVAGSLSESAGGTPINETISAFSLLFDANGNVIGGARSAPASSCGSDLTYVAGASGLTSRSSAREINRTIEHRFGQAPRITSVNEAVSAGLVARTLGTTRPVIYYGVPQILVDQGICSARTLSWDPSATAFTCSPSITSGDILTLQEQNTGSTIQTYFAQATTPSSFPFPSQADWVAQRNSVEGDMMDYSAQVPVTLTSCNDTPEDGGGPPLDDTPLSCVITVAATPNPALLGTGVVWTTEVRNALGPITYEWTGTDNLSRFITKTQTSDELSRSYQLTGTKNANVSITNNGRTAICTQSIPVVRPMSATCSPDVTETEAGNTVTWTATVTGGQAPFTYEWSGTDNLSGSRINVSKIYNAAGTKTAQVIVTDSQNATRTVPCDTSVTITAPTSQPSEYDLGITVVGPGSVTWNGNVCRDGSGVCSAKFTENTEVTLVSGANDSATFTGWSGSLSGNTTPATIVMNGDKNVVATFNALPGDISLDARAPSCADGSGRINLSWSQSSGATGYIIQRSTSPNSGFTTLQDSGSVPVMVNGVTVTVSRPGSAASYGDSGLTPGTRYYYRITPVNASGIGNTSSDNTTASTLCSLSCSVTADSPSGQITHGTNVSVTSSGSAIGATTYSVDCGNGTSFDGSSGQCRYPIAGAYTITASASRSGATPASCTTTVNALEANKVLSVSKAGNGTCTVSGSGINCGSDCAESYAHGSTQTVTVTPASGSEFTGWSGDCSGTGSCSVVMDRSRSVTATCNRTGSNIPPGCTIDLKSRTASDTTLRDGSNVLAFNEILTLSYSGSNLAGNTDFSSTPFSGFWTGSEAASNATRTKQVSNVTTQRDYTFTIEGQNSAGAVCTDSVSIGVKPQTPALNAPVISCNGSAPQVDLTWNRSTFSDSFLLSSRFNSTESIVVSNYTGCSGNSCSFSDRAVVAGNTYSYRVRADNEHGSSQLSAERSITIPAEPCDVPQADLRISGTALGDSSLFKIGDTNSVIATIINSGNRETEVSAWADRATVRLPDGTETTSNVAHNGALNVNGTYSVSTGNITYTQEGIHRAIFCADVGALVDESNENNNCTEFQFNVRPLTCEDTNTCPTCEDLGTCPPVTVFPPVGCTMLADPNVATVGALVTYTASTTGGNGTYTYDWKDHTGADWGADTTTTLTEQSKSAQYNSALDYTTTLNVSSWVGTSTSATFETVSCSTTHLAQPQPQQSAVNLEYVRECKNDGTILWDRVVISGWTGRSSAPITRVSRSGGSPLPTGFINDFCDTGDCSTWDAWIEPGNTYTYNVRHYSGLQTDPPPLIIDIGTESIDIPENDCPVIPEPTCSVESTEVVMGNFARFTIEDLTYSPNRVMWNCRDEDGTNNWVAGSGRGHWRMFESGGPKDCRFVIQDGPNRWSNDTCPIVVSKPQFECYATFNNERVSEVPLGATVQWKYDINDPNYVDQAEGSYRWRNWYIEDDDVGTESYVRSNLWGPLPSKRIYWWPAGLQLTERYATTTRFTPDASEGRFQFARRFSEAKDFFITYSTPGVKTIRGVHQVKSQWQQPFAQTETCSVNVVEPPLELECATVVGTDRNVIPFPGAPTNPTSADYRAFQFGTITDGPRTESQTDAMILDITMDRGDGTPATTFRRTGAQIRSGEGLDLTFETEGTYTPTIQITEIGGSGRTSAVAQCPDVEVREDRGCNFTLNSQQLVRIEQDEVVPVVVTVQNTGDQDPGPVNFTASHDTELIPGVTATFNPIDCDPDMASCTVTMNLTAATDAPGTAAPALASYTGRSNLCNLDKNKVFFIDVRNIPGGGGGPSVDLKVNNSDGPVKLSRGANGNLVANVFAQSASHDVLVSWETTDAEGVAICEATQEVGSDFEGDVEANGSQIATVTSDDIFEISCTADNGNATDTVEVRVIGADPSFEEF